MHFNFLGGPNTQGPKFVKEEAKVAMIDKRYDRSLRLWTCLWLDAEGNQLGCAQYANNRAEMKELVKRMEVVAPAEWQI